MKKKKIILIIVLSIITLVLMGILVSRNSFDENKEKIIQTNERDMTKEQVEITNDYINIREENDSQSETVGKVIKGEIYTVLEKIEDEYYVWCKIETTDGKKGYIAVKYLEDTYADFLEIIDNSDKNTEE